MLAAAGVVECGLPRPPGRIKDQSDGAKYLWQKEEPAKVVELPPSFPISAPSRRKREKVSQSVSQSAPFLFFLVSRLN